MATGTIVYDAYIVWYRVAMEHNIVGPWGPFCYLQELAVPDGVVDHTCHGHGMATTLDCVIACRWTMITTLMMHDSVFLLLIDWVFPPVVV